MKSVQFEKIILRNFLSYGDEPVELKISNGIITFVTGKNLDDPGSQNGVGKTALLIESWSFLLFGETYKTINNDFIPNNTTNKKCIVEGYFKINDDSFYIKRELKPSSLTVHKNGEVFNKDVSRTIKETNKDIIEILGITKEVFMNTIVMTNKDSKGFFAQEKKDKISFIEGILGLEVFSDMFDEAKAEYNTLDKKLNGQLSEIRTRKTNIDLEKKYEKDFIEKKSQKVNEINKKISDLKSIIPIDNSEKIKEIDKLVEDKTQKLDERKDKLRQAEIKLSGMVSSLRSMKDNLDSLNEVQYECPLCKTPLDVSNKDEIEIHKKDLTEQIRKSAEQIDVLRKAIDKEMKNIKPIGDEIRSLKDQITRMRREQEEYSMFKNKIDILERELEITKNSENPFTDKILVMESELKDKESEYSILNREFKISQGVKLVCSPAGVKAVSIKKIINAFNNRLNYYLKRLNAPVKCSFDEFFEETFETKNGKKYMYGNLSGGEAKRVDFALLFTFRDIRRLQSNVSVNVSIFDEIFDSALDAKAMMIIMNLLKESSKDSGESFFIITHRPENVEVENCEILNLVKENGITTICQNSII